MAQKARREAKAKAKKEAERWRIVKGKKKRKKLEYIQQVWDEIIAEDTILLEKTERFQIMRSKYKEVTSRDKKGQQPSKKAKGKQMEKYCGGITVKMGDANPCKRYVSTRQDCLVHHLR